MNDQSELLNNYRSLSLDLREMILDMASNPAGAHIGGALSVADIMVVLFHKIMSVTQGTSETDCLVLSKGHCASALYAALAQCGYLQRSELATYARNGSRLGGHPSAKIPTVMFPTGSLGHGLSLGVGTALGKARMQKSGDTFVILGDGELQEGSVWEAASSATKFGLGCLCAVVDRNQLQINGRTNDWLPQQALMDRWESFGWHVECCDGHDHAVLEAAFLSRTEHPDRPTVIIANTVKGQGVNFMSGNKKSHYVHLNPKLSKRAKAELRKGYEVSRAR